MRLAVLVSGQGSNLRALAQAIDQGQCPAKITCVIADRAGAPALEFAAVRGIRTAEVRAKNYPDRASWDLALADALSAEAPDLIVLAGFMRIVGSAVLERFPSRLVNVHPSLLPAFPGMDAPAQAIAKGVTLSGCTVHLVDGGIDSGPILAQAAVPVLPDDDAATLHARIQTAEHRLLPSVIADIARGRLLTTQGAARPALALPPDAFVWPNFAD